LKATVDDSAMLRSEHAVRVDKAHERRQFWPDHFRAAIPLSANLRRLGYDYPLLVESGGHAPPVIYFASVSWDFDSSYVKMGLKAPLCRGKTANWLFL
jgi:hypothetical protein